MNDKQFETLNNKIDVMIGLLAHNIVKDMDKVEEQVSALNSVGLQPAEIAKILKKDKHNIAQVVHNLRKKKK